MKPTPAVVDPGVAAQPSIRAVHRVCDILDALQESEDGLSLSALARDVKLAKSSVFRYLQTLERRGYIERHPDGTYRVASIQPARPTDLSRLVGIAVPYLEQIRDELGETVNLGKLEQDCVRYAAIVESRRAVRLSARSTDRDPLHATALGKAIATTLPSSRIAAILERSGMPSITSATITDEEMFFQALSSVRELGYAVDDREHSSDGVCIAVPLFVRPILAALSLSAPAVRLPPPMFPKVAARLEQAAAAIRSEFQDGYSPKTP